MLGTVPYPRGRQEIFFRGPGLGRSKFGPGRAYRPDRPTLFSARAFFQQNFFSNFLWYYFTKFIFLNFLDITKPL